MKPKDKVRRLLELAFHPVDHYELRVQYINRVEGKPPQLEYPDHELLGLNRLSYSREEVQDAALDRLAELLAPTSPVEPLG